MGKKNYKNSYQFLFNVYKACSVSIRCNPAMTVSPIFGSNTGVPFKLKSNV